MWGCKHGRGVDGNRQRHLEEEWNQGNELEILTGGTGVFSIKKGGRRNNEFYILLMRRCGLLCCVT